MVASNLLKNLSASCRNTGSSLGTSKCTGAMVLMSWEIWPQCSAFPDFCGLSCLNLPGIQGWSGSSTHRHPDGLATSKTLTRPKSLQKTVIRSLDDRMICADYHLCSDKTYIVAVLHKGEKHFSGLSNTSLNSNASFNSGPTSTIAKILEFLA